MLRLLDCASLLRSSVSLSALCVCLAFGTVGCGDDDDGPTDTGVDTAADDTGADTGDADAADTNIDTTPVDPLIVTGDEREECAASNPLKSPFFGDLHVHTRFSFDAAAYDVRTGPADAYRFARGEEIGLPPYDSAGNPTRRVQLDRPLDFAAVTDHAELLAPTSICSDPSSPGYDTRTCVSWREGNAANADFGEFLRSIGSSSRPLQTRLCLADPTLCANELDDVWGEIIEAANEANDTSESCSFSAFVGYEWTGADGGGGRNIHRNIIFRGGTVLRHPISYVDADTPSLMWEGIENNCLNQEGDCDLISIPHNSNISVGQMFIPERDDETPYDAEFAARRSRLEPLVEMYQHKGSSECVSGIVDPLASEDELCAFEQVKEKFCAPGEDPLEDDCVGICGEAASSFVGRGCVAPQDFVRGALRNGLAEWARVGENPFQFGFIGSTDTHNATPGEVTETNWQGHTGDADDEPEEALEPPGGVTISLRTSSPGGLAVVWAERNTRADLFDGMRARETYATSGPRIVARFFGGFGYADDICDNPDLVQVGYDEGVPMGGVLTGTGDGAAPVLVVNTLKDPESVQLQRVQIIKGWLDADGESHEQVFELAGDPDNGATVDTATCEPSGAGFDSLCGRWVDPEFDPALPAFYYARIVENPTCRWSQRLCLAEGVDCATVDPTSALSACCDGSIPQTVQERAWTSPIWYLPGD